MTKQKMYDHLYIINIFNYCYFVITTNREYCFKFSSFLTKKIKHYTVIDQKKFTYLLIVQVEPKYFNTLRY